MNFGEALAALRAGHKVSRDRWNYVGECVILQKGYPDGIGLNAQTADATGLPEGTRCAFGPYLLHRQADGVFQPWTPSHDDLLADDWEINDWPLKT